MPAAPGYAVTLYLTGTSTSMTAEAMSGSGAGPYQITNAAKRVMNPATSTTFYDNGVAISSGDISSVDYLLGKVTFTGSKTGPITVTSAYLPLLSFAEAHALEMSFDVDELEADVFGTGERVSAYGLMRITGSIETYTLPLTDLDPGAGSRKIADLLRNGTQFVMSLTPVSGGSAYRFFCTIFDYKAGATVDSLIDTSVSYSSQPVTAADGTRVSFSVGT